MKPKIKVVGAEFERVIHPALCSAHAPGLFLKPDHRSAPAPAIFDPLRSVFRSRSAHMLWSSTLACPLHQGWYNVVQAVTDGANAVHRILYC